MAGANNKPRVKKNKAIVFTAMGFELIGIILGCIYIGQYIDNRFGTKGLALVGFSVLGLVGWLVHIIRLLKLYEADTETSDT